MTGRTSRVLLRKLRQLEEEACLHAWMPELHNRTADTCGVKSFISAGIVLTRWKKQDNPLKEGCQFQPGKANRAKIFPPPLFTLMIRLA